METTKTGKMKTRSQLRHDPYNLIHHPNQSKPSIQSSGLVISTHIHTDTKKLQHASTCKVIIPTNQIQTTLLKPHSQQPKKPSLTLAPNLLDLEPLEKEQSIRQWVDSQRCTHAPTHALQREFQLHHQSHNISEGSPRISIPDSRSLVGKTDHQLGCINGLPRSQSTPEYRQVAHPASIAPTRVPPLTFLNRSPKITENRNAEEVYIPHDPDQMPSSLKREQPKNQINKFGSRDSQSLSNSSLKRVSHSPEHKTIIDQASPPKNLNEETFSIPDNVDGLDPIQLEEVHAELNESDPFGFIQAEKEFERAASTGREGIRADNTQSHSNQRNVINSRSKSAINSEAHIPTKQARNVQDSDISLGDLLNIKKNKKNRILHSKKITVARKTTPQDAASSPSASRSSVALSSSSIELKKGSRISQRQNLYPRKAKLTGLEKLSAQSNKIHRRVIQNDENLNQAESGIASPEALQGRIGMNAQDDNKKHKNPSLKTKTRTKKKIHSNEENPVLTPIVIINTKSHHQNLRNRSALKPKTHHHNRSKLNPKEAKFEPDSKSLNCKRPNLQLNIDNEENQDDQDPPTPNRKARLSYYKNLDNLSLEEEIVI